VRVLVFTQYYPPEVGATQNRLHFFASSLAARGHEVTVVTELPNHPSGIIWPDYRGRAWRRAREDGVDVVRIWVKTAPKKTFATRIQFYLSYAGLGYAAAMLLSGGRHDVVFASSPPLTVGIPAWFYARSRGVPLVLDIRDPWPRIAVELGEMRNPRAIALARRLERTLYRDAAAITAVTRGFVDEIERSGVPRERLTLLPNGTMADVFSPGAPDAALKESLGLAGRFVVGYFGTHGIAQDLPNVVEAAALLADDPRLRFVFVGEGPVKADLVARTRALGLDNVLFLPQVPLADAARQIRIADVGLVPLRRIEMFDTFVPSKLFDLMACACPVLLQVDGEARSILEESRGGRFVPPGDPRALAAAIRALAGAPDEERRRMGEAGAAFVRRSYLREQQVDRLIAVLEGAIDRSRPSANSHGDSPSAGPA